MIKQMNVIMYDDDNIKYFDGVLCEMGIEQNIEEYQLYDELIRKPICFGLNVNFNIPTCEISDTIKLDDTLMKRIAKFNKEEEIKKLDEDIKKKKEKIKKLENILEDREKRVEKIKEYIANIYDIDINDDENDWID